MRRLAFVLAALVSLAGTQPPGTRVDEHGHPILSASTDLVVLHVTVLDRKNGYVAGLAQDAFTVYEDGQPQTITVFRNEDAPVTVGLVIDNSASMYAKRTGVIAAGLGFARSSHPEDEMFTVNFNERVSSGLPEGTVFTNDIEVLKDALDGIRSIGMTALYDAVRFALDHLQQSAREKRVLIVVSDGSDNASTASFDEVMRRARAANVTIYTVGIFERDDRDAKPKVLKSLASATGGQAFFPTGSVEVRRVLERISRDIRSGYTIGYTSTNGAPDGKFRRILVRVKGPDGRVLDARTRPGYQAPSATSTGGVTRP